MIKSKSDYIHHLIKDKEALGIARNKPKLFGDEVWKFQRILRKYEYLSNCRPYGRFTCLPLLFARYKFHSLSLRLGFTIPINVFGPGLAIVHYGTIVVSSGAQIGKNCRIHEGVTIGATNGSSRAAILGDNVFIGSGAKIIGEVSIPSNVAIAANAVVVKDVVCGPHGCTVGGVPAKIISHNNSSSNIFIVNKE
jgi:serine O-acetyltransferase